jgi:hypothetical protein
MKHKNGKLGLFYWRREWGFQMKAKRFFLTCLVVFLLAGLSTGPVHAQLVPDLSIWVDTWFKLSITQNVYHFDNIGMKPTPGSMLSGAGISFMHIVGWDLATGALTANIYGKNAGVWDPKSFLTVSLPYFAGSDLKFAASLKSETAESTVWAVLFFKGKKDETGQFILDGTTNVKTLGGAYSEIDDVPGSTERWAGSIAMNGTMVPLFKVPVAIRTP